MKVSFLKKSAISLTFLFASSIANAEVDYAGKVTAAANTFRETAKTVSTALCIAFLAIGLITVVYNLANNKPNSKEFIMGWLAAVILSGVFAGFL